MDNNIKKTNHQITKQETNDKILFNPNPLLAQSNEKQLLFDQKTDIHVKELKKEKTLMDNNNKKAFEILKTKGHTEAVKHMLIHPETGEPMDYATMRYYYG